MAAPRTRSGRDGARRDALARRAAALATVLTAAVLVAPVLRSPPRDSFPLSTFPMFSTRIDAEVDVDYVIGLDAAGRDVVLDPETIAGTDEVIVAGSIVTQAVRAGSTAPAELCAAAAARVGADQGIVALEVRTDRVDAIAWFDGRREPLRSVVHASCEVR